MKKIALALLLLLMAGCAEDLPEQKVSGLDPAEHIVVSATVLDTTADTRGRPVSSQEYINGFSLFCTYTGGTDWTPDDEIDLMHNESMFKNIHAAPGDTDYWNYASGNPVRWVTGPGVTADDRYTFFAYAPYATATVVAPDDVTGILGQPVGVPYIQYTVPTDNANQPDLMIAARRENVRQTGNPVALTMRHALTAVGFKVVGNGELIQSVAITGFSDKGLAALDGDNIVWNTTQVDAYGRLLATPAAAAPLTTEWYEAGIWPATPADASGEVMTEIGWLMMIPQTLGPEARVRVTFWDGTPDKFFSLETQEWTAGQRVTYTLTVSVPTIAGVRNIGTAPGVIGYVWNPGKPDHMQLTMDKDDGNDTNGYVYVAYFKFGSLLAVSSIDAPANSFLADESTVIQWPTEWAETRADMEAKFAGSAAGTPTATKVPRARTVYPSMSTDIPFPSLTYPADPEQGVGDPCAYWGEKYGWGDDYKLPSIEEWSALTGGTALPVNVGANYNWIPPTSGTGNIADLGIGEFPMASGGSVTLPAAGSRLYSGGSYYQGREGEYWTNVNSSTFVFDGTGARESGIDISGFAAVRCVQPVVATNPVGEVAIPSADGTYTTVWAKTNLSATGVFADNETDNGAYFQWARDVAYPDNYGTALPALDVDQTDNLTWPDSTDPCPQGWRVPTREEWRQFVVVSNNPTTNGDRTFTSTYGSVTLSAAGQLDATTGSVNYQGSVGCYWTHEQRNTSGAWTLLWSGTGATINTSSFALQYGAPVRCVRTAA